MTRPITTHHALLLGAWGLASAAVAQGPTFDCSKAAGEVEQQICSDASLTALDRQLTTVYRAALAKASKALLKPLRAEQRGWVKGRNDCWKANGQPTWITATWTVDTVRGCIEAQYRLRMSELQAVWQLLPPTTVAYACQSNPANEVVARFFASDPPTIRLERGDRTKTLWQVGRLEDGRFEGQNVSLLNPGAGMTVTWLDTDTGQTDELNCRAR